MTLSLLSPQPAVRWRTSANITSATAIVELDILRTDDVVTVTGRLQTRDDIWGWAVLDVTCAQDFGVGLYANGVVQRTADHSGWIASTAPLRAAYAMSKDAASLAIHPGPDAIAVCHWDEPSSAFAVSIVAWGTPSVRENWVDGPFDPSTALRPQRVPAGTEVVFHVSVQLAATAAPPALGADCAIPDPRLAHAHEIAVWGSQVPSLGTLELRGSAYPTINLPTRAYGPLHTFFDPDAWSIVAALSYAGDRYLHAQARSVIDRAIGGMRSDGLVPHHFAHDDVEYIAISGSPQPGPNLFLIEAAVDSACADGNLEWLRSAWHRGLRAACMWTLEQFDETRDLLCVEGALWVDVFRRAGFTLDTNAMAIRTLARAGEIARVCGDAGFAARLDDVSRRIKTALPQLWSEDGDHFVTSRSADWSGYDDHIDAENYLAVATGGASDAQAQAIFERLDAAPEMHPGGRGTLVSLRRYEAEDCYLDNTGDSDIAMARLWWADLMARHAVGDRAGFLRYFEPVVDDIIESVWMRERYDRGGLQVRAHGYHEYPDLFDVLLREAYYGVTLTTETALVAPFASGPFRVRFGEIELDYSKDRVSLSMPTLTPRTVTVRGLHPETTYLVDGRATTTDADGALVVSGVGTRLEAVRS